MSDAQVQAAGGVVVRIGEHGPEVLVVHRPRYGDWSLPKGKLDPGEDWEQAALREVEEETGLRCELDHELSSTTYTDRKGRSKLVRYWAMTEIDGEFSPNDEVDEIRWLSATDAAALLSYGRDAELIDEALA